MEKSAEQLAADKAAVEQAHGSPLADGSIDDPATMEWMKDASSEYAQVADGILRFD